MFIKILLMISMISTSAIAQLSLKKAGTMPAKTVSHLLTLGWSVGLYFFSFMIYTYLLRHFAISKLSPLMLIATMLCVILGGVFIFKEQLSTTQLIGIVMGVVGIVFISL